MRYWRDNDEIEGLGVLGKARLAARTVWAADTRRDLDALLAAERPIVAHFHNTFPLISPAAFAACRAAGVPVVLTVHNFRLSCTNALYFRDGHACEDCNGRAVAWPGVLHACYRGSRVQSAVVAGAYAVHRAARTWSRLVDVFTVPSRFAATKLAEAGAPADRILVRPNFLAEDPGDRAPGSDDGTVLFVGRLAPEKGAAVLVDAAAAVPEVPVVIAGDGPERATLEETVRRRRLGNVTFLGPLDHAEVLDRMRRARVLVVPSLFYETFGIVVLEACASGLPAIVSGHGALEELVDDHACGVTFRPGDAGDLAARLQWASERPTELAGLGRAARAAFEADLSAAAAYERLTTAYERARSAAAGRAS